MKINVFLIIGVLFFFFNSTFLPLGLLYTTILTPIFYFWLLSKHNSKIITNFLLTFSPFIIAHIFNDVIIVDYLISFTLFFTVYIFVFSVYLFLKKKDYLALIFKRVTLLNFALTIIALITLFTAYKDLWAWHSISANINNVPRLKLFTYEPSYYATLLVPIIFFFLLNLTFYRKKEDLFYLLLLLFSLALSFSFGVIAAILIAISIVLLNNLHKISIKRKYFNIIPHVAVSVMILALALLIIYPTNPLYLRVYNIITGNDSSGRGRTFEAIEIAMLLLEKKDMWFFGIGLGQIKTFGYEIIMNYYQYPRDIVKSVAIPNSFAETLAIFGLLGASLRILLQFFLFFKTKVYNNYYQSLCFTFIFIYQFTGSYITNPAEYMIWLLAFVPYFKQFDKQKPVSNLEV